MRDEYDFSKMKQVKSPFKGKSKKKGVHINLSTEVIEYFKDLSVETDIPYQKLIDLYLKDCAKNKKKINLNWSA